MKNKKIIRYLLILILGLGFSNLYLFELYKEKNNQSKKLLKDNLEITEKLNKKYKYKLVVFFEDDIRPEVLSSWEKSLDNKYEIPDGIHKDEFENEKKIMISFNIMVKNNDEMKEIHHYLKKTTPSLSNIESFYL